MSATAARVDCVPGDPDRFAEEIATSARPVLMRGVVSDWPAIAAAAEGPRALAEYILRFDQGRPVDVFVGPPEIGGRFFYRDDMRGFNFRREKAPLSALLGELIRLIDDPAPPALYAGAAAAADYLPGWVDANPLPLPVAGAVPRIWIGNASQVSTHYDMSGNVACVVAGRRRFTLFPPDQISNLYVGPLETTMAGQPTSMVNVEDPDLERYPRFAEALKHAMVADLEPGDAIFIPPLWWHNVRASGPFNVLVNYWAGHDAGGSPFEALIHALMSVRDLPPAEKGAWRHWFEHYVFGDDAKHAVDHLPEHARGVLGPASPERTDMMRGYLLRALSRR